MCQEKRTYTSLPLLFNTMQANTRKQPVTDILMAPMHCK